MQNNDQELRSIFRTMDAHKPQGIRDAYDRRGIAIASLTTNTSIREKCRILGKMLYISFGHLHLNAVGQRNRRRLEKQYDSRTEHVRITFHNHFWTRWLPMAGWSFLWGGTHKISNLSKSRTKGICGIRMSLLSHFVLSHPRKKYLFRRLTCQQVQERDPY